MAKDKSAKSEEAPAEPRDADRAAELAKQLEVIDAVFAVTHDDAGEPIPIIAPEAEE